MIGRLLSEIEKQEFSSLKLTVQSLMCVKESRKERKEEGDARMALYLCGDGPVTLRELSRARSPLAASTGSSVSA